MILWIFSPWTSPVDAAGDGGVLGEHADPAAVDRAEAGDHAVGVGALVLEPHAVGPVAGQHVELLERAVVEEVVDALAGGHLAPRVVPLDRPRASPRSAPRPAGPGSSSSRWSCSTAVTLPIAAGHGGPSCRRLSTPVAPAAYSWTSSISVPKAVLG